MFRRLRATSFAGVGALLLVFAVSGVVAAAGLLTSLNAPIADPTEPTVVDTTQTFEDANGNGIDDDCEEAVEADEQAAADAEAAVDLDGDGTVSVSEAAQSDRTGGASCNHGGYVSGVAHEECEAATGADADADSDADGGEAVDADEASTDGDETTEDADEATADETGDASCDETTEETTEQTTEETTEESEQAPTECETTPTDEDAPVDEPAAAPENNGHGKVVRLVAQDKAAVGGKNCNHGGAVSEASHQDNAARKEARDAAREAAKAARDAAREAAREAKNAAKGSHGKGKGGNH